MENQQNPTDSRKAALSPKQTLALPYIATASLATRRRASAAKRGGRESLLPRRAMLTPNDL